MKSKIKKTDFKTFTDEQLIKELEKRNYRVVDNLKTESQMWRLIEEADWKSDHDNERIEDFFREKLNKKDLEKMVTFVDKLMDDMNDKFEKDWLGKPGFDVSDDGWIDLRAEVIGRGEKFYKNITASKLRKMAKEGDYKECYGEIFGNIIYDKDYEVAFARRGAKWYLEMEKL